MNNTQWETEENSLAGMELVVEGVAIPVITTLGLVGNILSIIVLHSPGIDMKVERCKDLALTWDHQIMFDIIWRLYIK